MASTDACSALLQRERGGDRCVRPAREEKDGALRGQRTAAGAWQQNDGLAPHLSRSWPQHGNLKADIRERHFVFVNCDPNRAD